MKRDLTQGPPAPKPHRRFHVGLDLGQAGDYTAAAVLEVAERGISSADAPRYNLRFLERYALGTPYPEQVRRVEKLMQTPPLRGQSALVVDQTGAGRPVTDLFREADVSGLVAVTIHGGDSTTRGEKPGEWRVPKRDLAGGLQALLQSGRLRFAEGLAHAETLREELQGFRVKVSSESGHERFEHRAGAHDDLVLALALACWHAERERQRGGRRFPVPRSSSRVTGR